MFRLPLKWTQGQQDQGTSAQKTVWVWSGFDHMGAVNSYFSVYSAIFGMVTNNNNQPTNQTGDPSASLLSTSEKAVFCN